MRISVGRNTPTSGGVLDIAPVGRTTSASFRRVQPGVGHRALVGSTIGVHFMLLSTRRGSECHELQEKHKIAGRLPACIRAWLLKENG